MSDSLSPPTYTSRFDAPLPAANKEIETASLRHLLIVILAFTYDVDLDKLRKALASSSLPLSPEANASALLLSQNDINFLLELASAVITSGELVYRNEVSLIEDAQRAFLIDNFITPATALNIEPWSIMKHVRYIPEHKFDPRLRHWSSVYEGYSRVFGWRRQIVRDNVAKVLISDDLLVEKVAPSEEVRLLLGSGLASFRERCKCNLDLGTKWQRESYGNVVDVALACELGRKR